MSFSDLHLHTRPLDSQPPLSSAPHTLRQAPAHKHSIVDQFIYMYNTENEEVLQGRSHKKGRRSNLFTTQCEGVFVIVFTRLTADPWSSGLNSRVKPNHIIDSCAASAVTKPLISGLFEHTGLLQSHSYHVKPWEFLLLKLLKAIMCSVFGAGWIDWRWGRWRLIGTVLWSEKRGMVPLQQLDRVVSFPFISTIHTLKEVQSLIEMDSALILQTTAVCGIKVTWGSERPVIKHYKNTVITVQGSCSRVWICIFI